MTFGFSDSLDIRTKANEVGAFALLAMQPLRRNINSGLRHLPILVV